MWIRGVSGVVSEGLAGGEWSESEVIEIGGGAAGGSAGVRARAGCRFLERS